MNKPNLHNRIPKDLPDRETIDDILLELKDTNNFDIRWVEVFNPGMWKANSRSFQEWVEYGVVVINEIDYSPKITYELDENPFTTSIAQVKEKYYNIHRYPIRIEVRLCDRLKTELNRPIYEIEMSKDVYLRLKDYLGPDIIQDQFSSTDFMIDFLISDVKLIKPGETLREILQHGNLTI